MFEITIDSVLFKFEQESDYISFIDTLFNNCTDRKQLYDTLMNRIKSILLNPENHTNKVDLLKSMTSLNNRYGFIYDPQAKIFRFSAVGKVQI